MTATPPELRLFHAIPLHYLPTLLTTGSLLSQRQLREQRIPILPRRTAFRRDRKLHLDNYVHLSLIPITPLLIDKRQRGYPHALLEFDAAVADQSNAHGLRFNPKAWRHRDDFAPITDAVGKAQFFTDWRAGSYPSAELLIAKELPLVPNCTGLFAATPEEEGWIREIVQALTLALPVPLRLRAALFPAGPPTVLAPLIAYADICIAAGKVLPPPDIPFD
jgi:hypothetical protein